MNITRASSALVEPTAPSHTEEASGGGARTSRAIIGGVFALQSARPVPAPSPPFLRGGEALFVNARSAIATLIELLSPQRVWVPSYLCASLLTAVSRSGVPVKFYPIGPDLRPPGRELLDEIQPRDLVVLIDYFGMHGAGSWAAALRERGAWVLEDAGQALLTPGVGANADFVVFSPRKFLGIPDGGILVLNTVLEGELPVLEAAPAAWWSRALAASVLRAEFDLHGGDRGWFEHFQRAEAEAPIGRYALSELSRRLLMHCFDYAAIARQRVLNYRALYERLHDLALLPALPDDVVPLGFPIRVGERDRVRHALFRHDVFPPVHWQLEGIVPAEFRESHQLAGSVMTLPCDQRYDSSDMERMARLVRDALGS